MCHLPERSTFTLKVRMFDCRTPNACSSWSVAGEVERVLWDHFNPSHCLASTESGTLHYIDVRKATTPVWTLSAHSEAVTGISLSPHCHGVVTTVSQDKMLKVWDISGPQPAFVGERALGLGTLHTLSNCPDVPFVVAAGGDKSSDNFKVMDLRELAPVRSVFGKRQLSNPLNTTEFGFATAEEAEPAEDMDTVTEAATNTLQSMSISPEKPSGGAAAKFRKKDKDKKKKKKKQL